MKVNARFSAAVPAIILLVSVIFTGIAWAETVELVTYYPTSANSGDQHLTSLTVGNDYLATTLANGQALIQTSLGIGTGFANNEPAAPTVLEVRGVAGDASQALFLPGAGGTMSVVIGRDGAPGAGIPGSGLSVVSTNDGVDIRGISVLHSSNGIQGGILNLLKSRAAGAVVQAGDYAGGVGFWFFNNGEGGISESGYTQSAAIWSAVNNATPGSEAGHLEFYTTNAGVSSEKIRIAANGNVGIGTAAPGQTLTVNGTLGILEGGANPTDHTIFQGGTQTGDITYSLPAAQGAADTVLANNGAGVLSWSASAGGGVPNTVVVFNASGNWTAPAGVTRINVQVWGGGGGGGGATSCSGYGSGGGGGGYAESILAVTPGTTYTVTVGAGGTGGASIAGTAGGTSFFNTAAIVSATGGAGGLRDCEATAVNSIGGNGLGTITITGASGDMGGNTSSSVPNGGDSPLGGSGGDGGANSGTPAQGNGRAGIIPGGGGGGAGGTGTSGIGGNGAHGRVVIRF